MEQRINLKLARIRCNLTQDDVAKALGVTQQTVSKWEAGSSPTQMSTIKELESLLGAPRRDLFPDIFLMGGEADGHHGQGGSGYAACIHLDDLRVG